MAGHDVQQVPMERPLDVAGVGKGSNKCNFRIKCTVTVPHSDGNSHFHTWSAPIVEGKGDHLPGLLGMDSLSSNRATLDSGKQRLIDLGPGGVTYSFSPRTVEIPFEAYPLDHRCVVIVDYANLARAAGGGVPIPIPTLEGHPASTAVDRGTLSDSQSRSTVHSQEHQLQRRRSDHGLVLTDHLLSHRMSHPEYWL